MFNPSAATVLKFRPQVGLWEEAWLHQRGEGDGATETQVQEGVQGRSEGAQEGLKLPGQREAQ